MLSSFLPCICFRWLLLGPIVLRGNPIFYRLCGFVTAVRGRENALQFHGLDGRFFPDNLSEIMVTTKTKTSTVAEQQNSPEWL